MLNHTYTSVKNANLVDCGKKQHIPSQPSPLLKDNFLGEFRTELDKKKVLANLGIASDLVLEWGNIKGDIGDNAALIQELNARTNYISKISGFSQTLVDGIIYLETTIGGEQDAENAQNNRIQILETAKQNIETEINTIKTYLSDSVDVNIKAMQESIDVIDKQLANITSLITVSSKEGNALEILDGETPGLYVPNLSERIDTVQEDITELQGSVTTITESLDTFVTKNQLGGDGDFKFVNQSDFDGFSATVDSRLDNFETELEKTVKTGEDGHVDTLYVNKISKDNDGNIEVTDSFEITTDKPLDIRFVKETIDDLLSIPVSTCYEGMGVIVNSLSALYILKPTVGKLTQEYVSDINNWKCPEDLVTVAISQADYDKLEEKNPNVFYYIYEEEFTLTKPPRREEYESDEDFENAKTNWENQIKHLDQQYVSASWGIEIEEILSKKASNEAVNSLKSEINAIKGNGEGPSLGTLGNSINELQTKTDTLEETVKLKSELLESIETNVSELEQNLSNCVTKEELQDETKEFIFVKTSDYASDKTAFSEQLAAKVETDEVITNTLNTANFNLNNSEIKVTDAHLSIDGNLVAFSNDLLKVQVLTQTEYNNKESAGEIDDKVYYYTYEDESPMATKAELQKAEDRIFYLETELMLLAKRVETLEGQLKE